MQINALRTLVKASQDRGQIPEQPLVDISAGHGQAEEYAALVVDLADVMARAEAAQARSLDVYADTLVVSADRAIGIGFPVLRVTIIARHIIAEDGARLVLDHSAANPLTTLRILAGGIEGRLAIVSERDGECIDYDLTSLLQPHPRPVFTNFIWRDTAPATGTTIVPGGLLARGEALYHNLAATFHLVAGLIATQDEDADTLGLAHAMLRWIASWAGLQSDLAQIARLADGLRSILPEYRGDRLVRPIPPLTAASYLSLARARKDLAKAIELDARFLDQSSDAGEIARQFVKANLGRDDAENRLIAQNMAGLQAEVDSIQEAVERAAKGLRDRQLDQELNEIYLRRAQSHDRIDKIADASFQIAIGLVTLGASIAAICVGVPADPTASAKKDIQGVQGLFEAMKNTRKKSFWGPDDAFTEFLNIMRLYALPFSFVFNNAAQHKDSIKALASSAVQIKQAASAIAKSTKPSAELAALAAELGEATRFLAGSPSPLEARAAWDSLEATAVNGLDVVINDSNTAGSVKKAAADYKTAVQKVAIYGRLMAEQQARKDAALRALGTMALQKLAQSQKAEAYATLAEDLADRKTLNARIRTEIAIRQDEAARSFFCACYGLRGAQFYETYTTPGTLPVLPRNAAEFEAVFSDFTGDLDATSGLRGRMMDFKREIHIRDAGVLADFAQGRSVTITLGPDQPDLARLTHIRLTGLEIWAETDPATPHQIGVEIISATSFEDRAKGHAPYFTGESQRILFEYKGDTPTLSWTGRQDSVLPTPFADWLVTLYSPEAIPAPQALRLKLSGKAMA